MISLYDQILDSETSSNLVKSWPPGVVLHHMLHQKYLKVVNIMVHTLIYGYVTLDTEAYINVTCI